MEVILRTNVKCHLQLNVVSVIIHLSFVQVTSVDSFSKLHHQICVQTRVQGLFWERLL